MASFIGLSFHLRAIHFAPKISNPSSPISKTSSPRCRATYSPPPSPSPSSRSPFDLRRYWSSLVTEIDARLDLAVPVRFPESVHHAMRHAVLAGGAKRAPPVMCIASCELFGGDRSAAFPAACALEMVHAASLVHDDLPCMDSAELRRGRPSTHASYGVDMAVLAGDALFPLAFEHVTSETPPSLVPEAILVRVLAEVARAVGSTGMAAGQFLDLDLDLDGGGGGSEKDRVIRVLEKKFGEMAECSAACGALLGGAGDGEVERMRRYGRSVGMLYQVVDQLVLLMEEEKEGGDGAANGRPANRMRSKASVAKVLGMERAVAFAEELKERAMREVDGFADEYGERVLPLYSFVDYAAAVDRGFVVEGGAAAAAATVAG